MASNLQQTTKDNGRSVRIEVSEKAPVNTCAYEEMKAIIGLIDVLIKANQPTIIEMCLFDAREGMYAAMREVA